MLAASGHQQSSPVCLPNLSLGCLERWSANSSPFTHVVNTNCDISALCLTHQQFCTSSLTSGHLLVDLLGLSRDICQAVMLHYKLLKSQSPALSAHFVVPSTKRTYSSGLLKPAGLMMQTIQQVKRGRRKAVVIFNPPIIQRKDIPVDPPAGLSSLFKRVLQVHQPELWLILELRHLLWIQLLPGALAFLFTPLPTFLLFNC